MRHLKELRDEWDRVTDQCLQENRALELGGIAELLVEVDELKEAAKSPSSLLHGAGQRAGLEEVPLNLSWIQLENVPEKLLLKFDQLQSHGSLKLGEVQGVAQRACLRRYHRGLIRLNRIIDFENKSVRRRHGILLRAIHFFAAH